MDENGLRALLRNGPPEPRRSFDGAVIRAQTPGRPVSRHSWRLSTRWAVLAAVFVVALIAGLAIVVQRETSSTVPPEHTSPVPAQSSYPTSPPTSTSSSTSSAPSTSTASSAPPVTGTSWRWGGWTFTSLTHETVDLDSLVADGGSLYDTVSSGASDLLQRISPTTGAVEKSVPISQAHIELLDAGATLVVLSAGANYDELTSYSPETLAQVAQVRVPTVSNPGVTPVQLPESIITADARSGRVFIASGDRIYVDMSNTVRVLKGRSAHGTIAAFALSADGTAIYELADDSASTSAFYEVNATTGALEKKLFSFAAVPTRMQATVGGLWLSTFGGHEMGLGFRPFAGQSSTGFTGEANNPLTVSIIGSTAWIGGRSVAACADANTGLVRNQTSLSGTRTQQGATAILQDGVHSIVSTRGQLYGTYQGDPDQQRSGLVRITPPTACR